MSNWRCGLIFDLDDTLYLEELYVQSGFRHVSETLASNDTQVEEYMTWLMRCAQQRKDGRTFNHFLEEFVPLQQKMEVADLVEMYRSHSPNLTLHKTWEEVLLKWRRLGVFLGLISDGELLGQQLKVRSLGLSNKFEHIILTDQMGKAYWKPHRRAFEEMQAISNLKEGSLVYIGDNVAKDFIAPNALGWHTIRLRLPGQIRQNLEAVTLESRAKEEASSVDELLIMLERWIKTKN